MNIYNIVFLGSGPGLQGDSKGHVFYKLGKLYLLSILVDKIEHETHTCKDDKNRHTPTFSSLFFFVKKKTVMHGPCTHVFQLALLLEP